MQMLKDSGIGLQMAQLGLAASAAVCIFIYSILICMDRTVIPTLCRLVWLLAVSGAPIFACVFDLLFGSQRDRLVC